MINSYKAVIDAWGVEGGRAAEALRSFAHDVSITEDHAKQMRRRDSIAPEYWPRVVEKAQEKGLQGITLALLADLRTARSDRVHKAPKGRNAKRGEARATA